MYLNESSSPVGESFINAHFILFDVYGNILEATLLIESNFLANVAALNYTSDSTSNKRKGIKKQVSKVVRTSKKKN